MKYWTTNLWSEYGPRTLSEQQILDYYWNWWSTGMHNVNKPEELITPENCIDDWVVIHWAWEDEIGWRKMKDEVS